MLSTAPKSSKLAPSVRAINTLAKKGQVKQVGPQPQPNISDAEKVRIAKRRVLKAERDERMDVTRALTPVKTYMGGFTRPTDLRITNWFHGGAYLEKGKTYLSPPDSAYEAHTVFLLESRYDIVHEVGRAETREHIVGVCRAGDLPAVLEMYNGGGSPEKAAMDNARWPWVGKKKVKHQVWWEAGQDAKELARQLWAGEGADFELTPGEVQRLMLEDTSTPEGVAQNSAQRIRSMSQAPSVTLLGKQPTSPSLSRALHTTAVRLSDDDSTSHADRAQIPGSSWSRPPKESQDAHDNVVPTYYIERKRQLDDIAERKETEGGLMAHLSAGILGEGIAAQIRVREEKIPVEVLEEDGVVRHPSGFEPLTPETDFHPVASKPNVLDSPLLTTVKMAWDEALDPSSADAATEATAEAGPSSPPKLSRGFHTSAVASARTLDLPPHVIKAHMASISHSESAPPADESASAREEDFEEDEDFDDSDLADAPQITGLVSGGKTGDRARYLAAIKETPFWRPLLTATFSTRPLAITVARLARSLSRGTPYHAAIVPDDRKYGPSVSGRMREMRVRRFVNLVADTGELLAGARGGFLGIRFSPEERGRGINGEGLADPIPQDKRVIQVGVGEWYQFADSLKETISGLAEDKGLSSEDVQVFGLDERGQRTDGVAWPAQPARITRVGMEERALGHLSKEKRANLTKRQRQAVLDAYAQKHHEQIVYDLAVRDPKVTYPKAIVSAPAS